MKRGVDEHPKTGDLRALLGISTAHAVGILAQLWKWTGTYARRGNVGRYTNQAIADGVKDELLGSDPDRLVNALVQSGWLDQHDEHRLVIHDWWDHAEDHVHAAVARGREFFVCGRAPRLRKLGEHERSEIVKFYSENAARPAPPRRRRAAVADAVQAARRQARRRSPSLPFPSESVPVVTPCISDSTVGAPKRADGDPDSLPEPPPVDPVEPPPPPEVTKKRGSRVPEPFDLDAPWNTADGGGKTARWWATRLGVPPDRVDAVRDEFVDYWRGVPGNRGVKLDWLGTWRNRCRDVAARSGNGGRASPGRQRTDDDYRSWGAPDPEGEP